MRFLIRTSNLIDKVVQWLVFTAIFLMTLIISLQIISRVFFEALSWTEELSRYLLVWSSFLGASIGIKRGAHIAVTFFTDQLKGKAAILSRVITLIIMIVFFALAGFYSIRLIQMQVFQISPALKLPMKHVYLVIPISMFMMMIHSLSELVQSFERGE